MAKIPRTQRYVTLAFQFARISFIILIGLLAIKVLFRLTSLPVLMIIVYVSMLLVSTVLFRTVAFMLLKTYRSYGKSAHHVMLIADAFSDGVISGISY